MPGSVPVASLFLARVPRVRLVEVASITWIDLVAPVPAPIPPHVTGVVPRYFLIRIIIISIFRLQHLYSRRPTLSKTPRGPGSTTWISGTGRCSLALSISLPIYYAS